MSTDEKDAVTIARWAAGDIEIETTTLKSTGKTLKIPTGKLDLDAPITGPFGMVITKTKCPSCGSGDVGAYPEPGSSGEKDGWGRQCRSCHAFWGADADKGVHVHTGEAVRQLMEANDGRE